MAPAAVGRAPLPPLPDAVVVDQGTAAPHPDRALTQIPHQVVGDPEIAYRRAAAGDGNGRAALPRNRTGTLPHIVERVPVDDDVVRVLEHAEFDLFAGSVTEDVTQQINVSGSAEVGCATEVDVMLVISVGRRSGLKLAVDDVEVIDNSPLGDVLTHAGNRPLRSVEGDVRFETSSRCVEINRRVELGVGGVVEFDAEIRAAVENHVLDSRRPVVPASDGRDRGVIPRLDDDFVSSRAIQGGASDWTGIPDVDHGPAPLRTGLALNARPRAG